MFKVELWWRMDSIEAENLARWIKGIHPRQDERSLETVLENSAQLFG